MIEQKSIDRLLEQTDIVDVISNYVQIKKSGSNYKCLCPFHDDKTPSMSISPSKQIYHCFSCKAGGNAIKFIMEFEKITYPEAIEKLASLQNFTLSYTQNHQNFKENKQILENLNAFYRSRLPQNQEAMSYLFSRGFTPQLIQNFEIGYAPDSQATIRALQNDKIEPKEALEVGVVKQNEKGIYASFIHRITFPIYSHTSRLVGFGGRTITGHEAKYVNSPQSEIFDKSKLLYGYHLAKKSIAKKRQIIIVEGYLDVIMLHKAGFDNAVAVLGTALTQKHLPLLKRDDISVVLCFDGDDAGINAATKSSHLLALNNIDASVVIIQGGADPADMVMQGRIEYLDELFKNGVEIGEFYIRQIAKKYDLTRPLQKQKCLDEILNFTNNLSTVISSSYIPLVSRLIGYNVKSLGGKIENTTAINKTNNKIYENFKKEIKNSKDILEISILKTFKSKKYTEILSEIDDAKFFKFHCDIYMDLKNNSDMIELEFYENIKEISSEDDAKNAVRLIKLKYYENKKNELKASQDADIFDKMTKINQIILKLKSKT
ncbi:DNA primase [Campylobacter majalis]|uniref:DNA primase n=1 Tax=Campylobacter majalis TaxID=2790656 RepID=A0ABN7K2Z5_9BACT|nr:DNA primase [Campylobacter majalis]CAD7286850.1 DNA primase [Campylobacter majalis]